MTGERGVGAVLVSGFANGRARTERGFVTEAAEEERRDSSTRLPVRTEGKTKN
jgi:hypothetical protein